MRLTIALLLALAAASCRSTIPVEDFPPHVWQAFREIPVVRADSLTKEEAAKAERESDRVMTFTLTKVHPSSVADGALPDRHKLELLQHILWNTDREFDLVLVEIGPRYAGDYYVGLYGDLSRFDAVDLRTTALRTNRRSTTTPTPVREVPWRFGRYWGPTESGKQWVSLIAESSELLTERELEDLARRFLTELDGMRELDELWVYLPDDDLTGLPRWTVTLGPNNFVMFAGR